ncbi:hypothetical protein [Micromonospora inaquosa]|uniref:Uncharacterized protein n=1 Tax=Micromonospora inaquosa TaxID=2203716 RepID=A0A3N9WWA7_9ACTN|nr:hypothetical protein [Micromonospora inaquosa]RQX05086.1 hypothetical protein DLJ59_08290 [Micromonospora inaquosa]
MRFVRVIAGVLLLVVGIPALFVGGGLWLVTQHADPGGAFTGRLETVRTPGHAVVVTDLDRLLRQDAPFARTAQTRLRLEARTTGGPAFVGLAPTAEVRGWLESVPHATVRRVALARGPLPVRLDPAGPAADTPGATTADGSVTPLGRPFWVREGIGSLEWSADDLADEPMSLVVMRPDGGADLALDLRAELRAGWTGPAAWGLLTVGVLLVVGAVLLLLRPLRPREVIFVVEPDQVPVLAGRLGVTSLSGLGPRQPESGPSLPARQLTPVGAGTAERPRSIGAARPATLADLDEPVRLPRPPEVTLSLAWPPADPDQPTARPVAVSPADGPAGGDPAG